MLAELPDFVRRRTPLDHLALYVISSWFSVGPAIVIFLWGTHAPRWTSVPVYAAALGTQFLFDYLSQYLMVRPVLGISPLAQLRSVLPAFAVDTLLAPLGLLVAFVAYGRPWALLLVLPTSRSLRHSRASGSARSTMLSSSRLRTAVPRCCSAT